MKKKKDQSDYKTKFSITLEGWDAAVLKEAVDLELKKFSNDLYPASDSDVQRMRNWLVRWAIRSTCAALVKKGKIPLPFAVEIINENPELHRLRRDYPGHGPTGLAEIDEEPGPQPRWFVE